MGKPAKARELLEQAFDVRLEEDGGDGWAAIQLAAVDLEEAKFFATERGRAIGMKVKSVKPVKAG